MFFVEELEQMESLEGNFHWKLRDVSLLKFKAELSKMVLINTKKYAP